MKRRLVASFALLVGCSKLGAKSTLASLVGFEGEIEMSVDVGMGLASRSTLVMKIKGDKVRADMALAGLPSAGATIIDGGAKKSYVLMTATKQYVESDLTPTASAPKSAAVITKTGRTEKIAGYGCEVISLKDPSKPERTEMCVGKGLTLFGLGAGGPFSALGSGSVFEEALSQGFPLRVQMFDASGATLVKSEVTRVDKKSEPDSEFQVPPGYAKLALPTGSYPVGGAP